LHPRDDDIDLPGAGTSLYVPPEVIVSKDLSVEEFQAVDSYLTNDTVYGTSFATTGQTKTTKNFGQLSDKADVWGLGILIHQLAAGEHPFKLHGDCLTKPSPVLSYSVLEKGNYSNGLVKFLKGCLGKLKKNNRPDRWNWEEVDENLHLFQSEGPSFDEFYEKVMKAEFSTPEKRQHRDYRIFPITRKGYQKPKLLATANFDTDNFKKGDQIKLINYNYTDRIKGIVVKNESSTLISEQNQININLDQVTIDTPARVIKDFYCEAHSFPPIASYRNNDMNMIYDEKVVITGIHGYRFKCRKENGREGLVPNHVLLVEDE